MNFRPLGSLNAGEEYGDIDWAVLYGAPAVSDATKREAAEYQAKIDAATPAEGRLWKTADSITDPQMPGFKMLWVSPQYIAANEVQWGAEARAAGLPVDEYLFQKQHAIDADSARKLNEFHDSVRDAQKQFAIRAAALIATAGIASAFIGPASAATATTAGAATTGASVAGAAALAPGAGVLLPAASGGGIFASIFGGGAVATGATVAGGLGTAAQIFDKVKTVAPKVVEGINTGRTVNAVLNGEVPPPPISLSGGSFAEWAQSLGMSLLEGKIADDQKKSAEEMMALEIERFQRAAIEEQNYQNYLRAQMGLPPLDDVPGVTDPQWLGILEAEKLKAADFQRLLVYGALGLGALFLVSQFSE